MNGGKNRLYYGDNSVLRGLVRRAPEEDTSVDVDEVTDDA